VLKIAPVDGKLVESTDQIKLGLVKFQRISFFIVAQMEVREANKSRLIA
jgi:hypothetical protein